MHSTKINTYLCIKYYQIKLISDYYEYRECKSTNAERSFGILHSFYTIKAQLLCFRYYCDDERIEADSCRRDTLSAPYPSEKRWDAQLPLGRIHTRPSEEILQTDRNRRAISCRIKSFVG